MIELIPAIDLLDGKCVRLSQGDYNESVVYGDNPVEMALHWQSFGANRLHVVDLDGAKSGLPTNHGIIADMAAALSIPMEVGGGIRSVETIEKLLLSGVERCIIGTKAATDDTWAKEVFSEYGDRLVLGIDAKNGKVAVKGWLETTELTAVDLALKLKQYGAKRIIYTDISRDGMLAGPNIIDTVDLAKKSGMAIIASGGMSSINDIIALNSTNAIEAVILGRALYTGDIDLTAALKVANENI